MKKIIMPIILVAVIAIITYLVIHLQPKEEKGVLILSGNVEVTEMNLGFKVPGKIISLKTDEGEKVTPGQLLAEIDRAELLSQTDQNQAAIAEARNKLAELKAGSRPQEIEQAAANVKYAQAELTKANKDYQRADTLYQNGAISAQQMDAAKRTLDVASSQYKSSQQTLSLVKEGPRKETIRQAQDRVLQAEASLQTLKERIKDTDLYAPSAGVIIKKNVELGETVGAGLPVFTVGDLGHPWIKVYVKEDKLGKVALGQKASITIDSYPGKTFEGTITFISPEAEFTPKTIQTHEERVKLVYGVKISLPNPDGILKPGMPADVRIKIQE
jgi:HlyD family secretion protein